MSVPVDWKPERAVQAKLGILKNKNKEWLLKHAEGRTLCAHLEMATPPRPPIDNELASRGALATTVCRVSYRQWPDLFTITSTPRKFAKCLYWAVSPPPILHVFVSPRSYITDNKYNHTSYIHSYNYASIHQYFHTFLYSFVHNIYTTSFIHDCIDHPELCLIVSF